MPRTQRPIKREKACRDLITDRTKLNVPFNIEKLKLDEDGKYRAIEEYWNFPWTLREKSQLRKLIAVDGWLSYLFAVKTRNRFKAGEAAIASESYCLVNYAIQVIKGKLPEEMHNKMILLAMEVDNAWINEYFDFVYYQIDNFHFLLRNRLLKIAIL